MSSPALSKNPNFQPASTVNELNRLYNSPSAVTNPMTVENTIQKTVLTFGILIATAVVGWFIPALALPAIIAALVVGLVQGFKKEPSIPLIISYAILEGLAIGGISSIFENMFPGIVTQAVLASLVVIGITLALFASKKVRATPKMTKFFMIGLLSYLAFSLINFGLMITGITPNMFGTREFEVFGIPLGIIIGVFAVLLATYSLILDFTFIENGVNNKIDAKYGWLGAFGILVTVVWLYIEILRIFALSRQ